MFNIFEKFVILIVVIYYNNPRTISYSNHNKISNKEIYLMQKTT